MNDKVIILDDLEFAWSRPQLQFVKKTWAEGKPIQQIAATLGRNCDEVMLCIMHLARQRMIERREGGVYGAG